VAELARPHRYAKRCGRADAQMFYTYILKSKVDNKLYVGWTDNLKDRLIKHQKGQVSSTKLRRPFELIYYEACLNREDAIKREKSLKTGFGRAYIKRRLKSYLSR
jgi:putative endonuclease